jgi:predicted metal-dependent enzyme (double-stranded beta helix superfamily)
MKFDLERFIADCRSSLTTDMPPQQIREVVARAVSKPGAVLEVLGEPTRAGLHNLYRSDDLTVLNVIWAPGMTIMPHDHRMWAVIGIYGGREDNIFWRRVPDNQRGRIEAAGAKELCEKDTVLLRADVIHSVTNPISRFSSAIHVYGGDFFGAARSEWDPESLLEQRFDVERAMRLFAKSRHACDRPIVSAEATRAAQPDRHSRRRRTEVVRKVD